MNSAIEFNPVDALAMVSDECDRLTPSLITRHPDQRQAYLKEVREQSKIGLFQLD